jgi:hypothetical protein
MAAKGFPRTEDQKALWKMPDFREYAKMQKERIRV